jgi:transposase-like protein
MKKPIGRPADHSHEFMTAVAHRVANGELSQREAARRYGASHGAINSWVKKYRSHSLRLMRQRQDPGPKTSKGREEALENEVKDLKIEIAHLYLQVQMLKKAQAFEDQVRKEGSSIITSENLDRSGSGVR